MGGREGFSGYPHLFMLINILLEGCVNQLESMNMRVNKDNKNKWQREGFVKFGGFQETVFGITLVVSFQ